MTTGVLQLFGISKLEEETYEALLPLGDVPIRALINVTGQHPQIIYRHVDRLIAKGLVTTATRRHRRYVCAADPSTFEQRQAEKLHSLRAAIPELKALQHAPKEAQVHIERGNEAVQNMRRRAFSSLPTNGTYYIFNASGDRFYEIMGGVYRETEELRIQRKVRKKILAYESQRTLLTKNETVRTFVELKFLPEDYAVPISTNFFASTTAMQIWAPDPIVIVIESKEVAQSHKDTFEALWRVAKV